MSVSLLFPQVLPGSWNHAHDIMRHGFLQAPEVSQISARSGRSSVLFVHFRRFPTPVLDVAVEKRKVATLPVAVGWKRPPGISIGASSTESSRLDNDKDPGVDAPLVFINKSKNSGGWRIAQRRSQAGSSPGVILGSKDVAISVV